MVSKSPDGNTLSFDHAVKLAKSLVSTRDVIRKMPEFCLLQEAMLNLGLEVLNMRPAKDVNDMMKIFTAYHEPFLKNILDNLRNEMSIYRLRGRVTFITPEIYLESVSKYPRGQVEGFLAWLVVYDIRVDYETWSDGTFSSLVRVVPTHLTNRMHILKTDMSCSNGKVGWGAFFYEDGQLKAVRAGGLPYVGPARSPDIAANTAVGLHPLHQNSSVFYELKAILKGLEIAMKDFGWQEILIITDNYPLQQLLSGVYSFPPFMYFRCVYFTDLVRQLYNYAIIHNLREANLGPDSLAKEGEKLMHKEYEALLLDGVYAFVKMDNELKSMVRVQSSKQHIHVPSYGRPLTKQMPNLSRSYSTMSFNDSQMGSLTQGLEYEEKYSYEDQIVRALKDDDYVEFIKLLENGAIQKKGKLKNARFASKLLSWMLTYRAGACCGFFLPLARKNGLPIDLNVPLNDALFPIHIAATTLPYHFVELFLSFGARADVICKNSSSNYYLMLPIEAALSTLREKISWKPSQSVYKLLFSLCDKEFEISGLLYAIEVLLAYSGDEHKQEIIYRCVREEKIVGLAAMLFADATFNPGHCICLSDQGFMKLRTSFSEEIMSLIEEEDKFATNKEGNGKLAAIMKRKRAMMATLQLLEIIYKANLSGLVDTNRPEALARSLVDAGFHLTDDDFPNLDALQKDGRPKDFNIGRRSDVLPSYLQPRALFHTMPIRMRLNQQNSRFAFSSLGERGLSSAVQSFHASCMFKSRFRAMLCTPMDAQSQSQLMKATHAKELHKLDFSLCKKLPLFVAAIRRIMHA